MEMRSRFETPCAKCSGRIVIGELIDYTRDTKKVNHISCPESPVFKVRGGAADLKARLEKATEARDAAWEKIEADRKSYRAAMKAAYLNTPGSCSKCGGSHSVCTWWTLDGGGFSEYGACEDCKGASVAGYQTFRSWGSDHCGNVSYNATPLRPDRDFDPEIWDDIEAEVGAFTALNLAVSDLSDEVNLGRGDEVVVARGRKVPKGTVGKIFWEGHDSFGATKVGIVAADGVKHYTAKKNVDAVAYYRYV